MEKVTCDLCRVECIEWVDGKTIMGPWANMCLACHKRLGVGLGIGKGQRYQNGVQVEGGLRVGCIQEVRKGKSKTV